MKDEAKFRSPIHSTFEVLVVQHAVGHCHEELVAFCWPMSAAGIADFSTSLSILIRYNWFTGIQKPVVEQTGSRPPNSDHDLFFFWFKFGFGKCFGASSWSNHWAGHPWLSYKIHFSSHIIIQLKNGSCHHIKQKRKTLQNDNFLIYSQLMRSPLSEFFHLSNLLQTQNDGRMVNTEFFSNFSCSCKRISFNDQLSTSNGQPLSSSSSRLSSPLQNFLNHHCTVCSLAVPGPKRIADVVSCHCCFTLHF